MMATAARLPERCVRSSLLVGEGTNPGLEPPAERLAVWLQRLNDCEQFPTGITGRE
jgi:hypothetical protein